MKVPIKLSDRFNSAKWERWSRVLKEGRKEKKGKRPLTDEINRMKTMDCGENDFPLVSLWLTY